MAAGGAAGSLRRRRLGIELRELRTRAGLTLEAVADRYSWSVSKASRMELGRVPVSVRDVNDLLTLYGVEDPQQRETLVELAKGARQRDWWHRFDDVLPRQFSIYLGFEGDATSILTYETTVIPGLLQTADYTRTLVRASRLGDSAEDIERRVEARVERQRLLQRAEPPSLWAIVDEAAIRREVGGPTVMAEQLTKLMDVTTKNTRVTLQVVPFRAGAYLSMESGFIILEFGGPSELDVACLDLLTRSIYLEEQSEVSRYREAFEHLRATAASPADSRKLIAATLKEMKRDDRV